MKTATSPRPRLVIDARHRGPNGPMAGERVLGRSVLDHLLDAIPDDPTRGLVEVHARLDEHPALMSLVARRGPGVRLVTGRPPEDASILRSDRLYDPRKLRKALKGGRGVESATIWRLDRPMGLAGAADEMIRRRSYQPIGRFWALAPARWIARALCPTRARPNHVTIVASSLFLMAALGVAAGSGSTPLGRGLIASALAASLVLDTADGHLARLQGTSSRFGRWLDANLDELGDMALHAATSWAAYASTGHAAWLMLGMAYAMGKYLFVVGSETGQALEPSGDPGEAGRPAAIEGPSAGRAKAIVVALGHADLRWHLWIALAALGRLDVALVVYAAYFPARAILGAASKAVKHG